MGHETLAPTNVEDEGGECCTYKLHPFATFRIIRISAGGRKGQDVKERSPKDRCASGMGEGAARIGCAFHAWSLGRAKPTSGGLGRPHLHRCGLRAHHPFPA